MREFIGYEIREKYTSCSNDIIPGYPLGLNTVTIDSSLCRPSTSHGKKIKNNTVFFILCFRRYL